MDLDLTEKNGKNLAKQAKQPSDLERIMFNMVWFAMALTKHGGWTCCQDWFMRSNSVCPSIGNAKLPVFLSMCLVCAVSTYPHTHMAPWCANTERHYETPCDLNKNLGSAIHMDNLMGFPDESHLTTHPMHWRHRPKWHGKTPVALLPLAKDSSSGQGIRSWPDPPQGAACRRRLAGTGLDELLIKDDAREKSTHSKIDWSTPKCIGNNMGVSENSVSLNPMVNDHYPY